VALNRTDTKCK